MSGDPRSRPPGAGAPAGTPAASPEGESGGGASARNAGEEYRRFLWDRFQGEVYGEALFRTFAELSPDADRARKWRVLERLELETKRAIAAALVAAGTAADEDEDEKLLGARHGRKLARVPWRDFLRDFGAELGQLVERCERGEALARTGDEAAILRRITAHERALREWTAREIDGRADSLDPVYAVLESFAAE